MTLYIDDKNIILVQKVHKVGRLRPSYILGILFLNYLITKHLQIRYRVCMETSAAHVFGHSIYYKNHNRTNNYFYMHLSQNMLIFLSGSSKIVQHAYK